MTEYIHHQEEAPRGRREVENEPDSRHHHHLASSPAAGLATTTTSSSQIISSSQHVDDRLCKNSSSPTVVMNNGEEEEHQSLVGREVGNDEPDSGHRHLASSPTGLATTTSSPSRISSSHVDRLYSSPTVVTNNNNKEEEEEEEVDEEEQYQSLVRHDELDRRLAEYPKIENLERRLEEFTKIKNLEQRLEDMYLKIENLSKSAMMQMQMQTTGRQENDDNSSSSPSSDEENLVLLKNANPAENNAAVEQRRGGEERNNRKSDGNNNRDGDERTDKTTTTTSFSDGSLGRAEVNNKEDRKKKEEGEQNKKDDDGKKEEGENNKDDGKKEEEGEKNNPSEEEDLEDAQGLPEDTYGLLICCRVVSRGWWFGICICGLQLLLFILFLLDITNGGDNNPFNLPADVDTAVRVTQVFAILISVFVQDDLRTAAELAVHGTYRPNISASSQSQNNAFLNRVKPWKWYFSTTIRGVEGLLSMLVSFLLIIQSYKVFDLMLNFTAVLFLSELDELAFALANSGYFGNTLSKEAKRVMDVCYYFKGGKRFHNYYQSSLLVAVLTIMYVGFGMTWVGQEAMSYYECKDGGILVEFGDIVDPYLGIFTGNYNLIYGEDGKRVTYEDAFKMARLGFCQEESRWTLFYSNDPCNYTAKSSVTQSFDIMETESDTWYSRDNIPLEHIQFLCSEDAIERIQRCQYLDLDANWCPTVTVPGDALNGFPVETARTAQSFEALDYEQIQVYDHPVYWGQSNRGLDLIMFTGRRWVLADLNRFPLFNSTIDADSIQQVLSSHTLHASHFANDAILFITDTVDPATDSCSPVGLTWHHAVVSEDATNTTTKTFPSPNLLRPVSTKLSCSICNNQTNRCQYEGICQSNGICTCQNGATGSLCDVPPLHDGRCDEYFNTRDFDFDGGDCCGATCDSPACGLTNLVTAFGSDLTERRGDGFPNCIDESMVTLTMNVVEAGYSTRYWNANIRLECEGTNYFHIPFGFSNDNANNQTVQVKNGTECVLRIIPLDADSNLTIRISQDFEGQHHELLKTEFTGNDCSYDESFPVISTCLWKDVLGNSSLPDKESSQYKALIWMNDQSLQDQLPEVGCGGPYRKQLYASALMDYSFGNPVLQERYGWLSPGIYCTWEFINCDENLSVSRLHLEVFDLTGTIPTEIGYFSDLQELWLYNNYLTGTIPTELGLLKNLEELDLDNNLLNGTIPTELGLLMNLEKLYLKGNMLSGPIPSELGSLSNLRYLHLGDSSQFDQPPPESILHLCETSVSCDDATVTDSPTTTASPSSSISPSSPPSSSIQPSALCPETNRFQLDLTLDFYGNEISWDIQNADGIIIYESPLDGYPGGQTGYNVIERGCLEVGLYIFTLKDSAEDGLDEPGSYDLTVAGVEVLSGGANDFDDYEISWFTVPLP